MADLNITDSDVVAGAGAVVIDLMSNGPISAGDAVYRSYTTGQAQRADCNGASADQRDPVGIAINSATAGQPVKVLTSGPVTLGSVLTPGVAYYLSATAGGICPVADLSSGMYPTFIGIATSATVLKVNITTSGVAL